MFRGAADCTAIFPAYAVYLWVMANGINYFEEEVMKHRVLTKAPKQRCPQQSDSIIEYGALSGTVYPTMLVGVITAPQDSRSLKGLFT